MNPIGFKDAFAAGAAWGAAKDEGLDPLQQAQGAYLAAEAARKKNAGAKEEAPETLAKDAKHEVAKAEEKPETESKRDGLGLRKPRRQPGPGFLLRLAHWLNLK